MSMCVCACVCYCRAAKSSASSKSPRMWIPAQPLSKTSDSREQKRKQGEIYFLALESLHFSEAGLWLTHYPWALALDNEVWDGDELTHTWLILSLYIFSIQYIVLLWICVRHIHGLVGPSNSWRFLASLVWSEHRERKTEQKWICPFLKFCFSTAISLLVKFCLPLMILWKILFCSSSHEKTNRGKLIGTPLIFIKGWWILGSNLFIREIKG